MPTRKTIGGPMLSETQRRAVHTLRDDMEKTAKSSKVVPIDHQWEHLGT
jgi:hypothetical protein